MSGAVAKASNGAQADTKLSDLMLRHSQAMKAGDYPKALAILQQLVAAKSAEAVAVPTASTIADVLTHWHDEGPLVHEPTGIAMLDELTDGGPVYGSRWYASGAPDAGKTAFVVQTAHRFAERGIAIGLLAADEEDSDIVTRLAQRVGYSRRHCEIRDPSVLDEMRRVLQTLPIRLYCDDWTIERAAEDLAKFARERGDGRAMLVSDSLQTVSCDSEIARVAAGGRELSTAEAVTLRTKAIRAMGRRHRLIMLTTSELGRSAYASSDPANQTKTIASSKWSGSIEYAARVLLGVRSVAGEKDIIDVEIAKNKHGPIDEHVYLRLDRRSQTLTETNYTPPVTDGPSARNERKREQVAQDAVAVARILKERPGLGIRKLRVAVRAATGIGHDRVDAAVDLLGSAVVVGDGPRNAKPMTLDLATLPDAIRAEMEASK